MTEPLSSEHIISVIEEIRNEQPGRVTELWSWGYDDEQWEIHRWRAGDLYAYWLCERDEYPNVQAGFREFRRQIEAIDFVERVETESYQLGEEWAGTEQVGEKWRIEFNRDVQYTHR